MKKKGQMEGNCISVKSKFYSKRVDISNYFKVIGMKSHPSSETIIVRFIRSIQQPEVASHRMKSH